MTMQITHIQGWKFVGNIHAKTLDHGKNDIAKTHGLAIARVSRFLKGDNIWVSMNHYGDM